MKEINVHVLTRDSFKQFGDVIEEWPEKSIDINDGFTTRVHDLTDLTFFDNGYAILNFFISKPRPLEISKLECHPLGSQTFFPVDKLDWLIVVAEKPSINYLKAFKAEGHQGVSYRPGIWHHPILVFQTQKFIVIDRKGDGVNLKEVNLESAVKIKP